MIDMTNEVLKFDRHWLMRENRCVPDQPNKIVFKKKEKVLLRKIVN